MIKQNLISSLWTLHWSGWIQYWMSRQHHGSAKKIDFTMNNICIYYITFLYKKRIAFVTSKVLQNYIVQSWNLRIHSFLDDLLLKSCLMRFALSNIDLTSRSNSLPVCKTRWNVAFLWSACLAYKTLLWESIRACKDTR